MICSQCGNSLAEGAAACPRCGSPVYGGGGGAAGGGTTGGSQAFNFNASRWSQAEKITGVASLILLISLFLPWFTVSIKAPRGLGGGTSLSASGSGMDAHGYLWLVFILCLAVLVLLVLQAGFGTLPFNLPVAPGVVLLGATALNLLLVLVAFFVKPGGDGADLLGAGLSIGWAWGAFVGLLAAIAACVPLALPGMRARTGSAVG
jgi:zinc ribbon protein